MPSKSKKQHRLMEAVKHNPKFARKVGIPQRVGEDFVAADKRVGRYAAGGGVLGAFGRAAAPRMRPPAARPVPDALVQTDRALAGLRGPMRMMRAKGGKISGLKETLLELKSQAEKSVEDHTEKVAKIQYKYKPGDVVAGSKGNYKILGRTYDRKTGGPAYHVESEDGSSKFQMNEWGMRDTKKGGRLQ